MIFTNLDPQQVKVLDVTGNDTTIAKCARVCMKGLDVLHDYLMEESEVSRIIGQLMSRKHTSPFELAGLTFSVKCPIFVARQWMRHRTFRYLERSGRYCISTEEVYLPDKLVSDEEATTLISRLLDKYTTLIKQGVSKQEARMILPLGTYTEFVFQADLHNLLHFLKLRLSPAAQPEMRFYAQRVADKVKDNFPITWEWFNRLELKNDRETES